MTGEIARLWGNSLDSVPEPREAVRFAAAIHDIGWVEWEKQPVIDPRTGHPYDFLDMPKQYHLDIWNDGYNNSEGFGTLVALLVFRHNVGLAMRNNDAGNTGKEGKLKLEKFFSLARQREKHLTDLFRAEMDDSELDIPVMLDTLNSYILLWDYISLRMCMGAESANPFGPPPYINGKRFEMKPSIPEPETFTLSPWPFGASEVIWNAEAVIHDRDKVFNPANVLNRTQIRMVLKPA